MRKLALIALSAVIAASSFGCEEQEPIVQHRIPKPKPLPAAELAKLSKRQRIMGLIVPMTDRTWFFKLMGPESTVNAESENFTRFVESVKFSSQGPAPIRYSPPPSWKAQPGGAMALAAFTMGPEDHAAKFTITPLGPEAGEILPNIVRWRGQVGLPPITEAELANHTTPIVVDGHKGVLVEMTGAGEGAGSMMAGGPMMSPATSPAAPLPASAGSRPGAPTFTKPDHWQADSGSSMSVAAFVAGDAKLTLTPIPGEGGGVLSNVNRWRGQVGLAPVDQPTLDRESTQLPVAGGQAIYVDLAGASSRMLGAIVMHEGVSWFVKMTGPGPTIEREKQAFESFVKSLQFKSSGGGGA